MFAFFARSGKIISHYFVMRLLNNEGVFGKSETWLCRPTCQDCFKADYITMQLILREMKYNECDMV